MRARSRCWLQAPRGVGQLVLVLALLGVLPGCLDYELADAEPSAAPTAWLPQPSDFEPFRTWRPYRIESEAGSAHDSAPGETVVFLKEEPPRDASAFPIGTMLVKTMQAAEATRPTIHAMAKRSASFNAGGARGWEYFELRFDKNNKLFFLWRGTQPPKGEQYQSLLRRTGEMDSADPEDDCNSCHAKSRDGVLGDSLIELLKEP